MPTRNPNGVTRIPPIDEILDQNALRPVFQPIIPLSAVSTPYGWESLVRPKASLPMVDPGFLFEYAKRKGMLTRLDLACIRNAIIVGHPLTKAARLFLNVHPETLADDALVPEILRAAEETRIDLSSVVLEITEQGTVERPERVISVLRELRSLGLAFALDDVGVAYSHLPLIDEIRPAYLKISQDFGTGFESDPTKWKIVRNICALADDFGAEVVLEGIESVTTLSAAVELGISFGQGYLFSRPIPLEQILEQKAEGRSGERPSWFPALQV